MDTERTTLTDDEILGSTMGDETPGDADGKKRWSPGEVTSMDATRGSCLHDCSTLGGSSGSCILALASHKVVGMHFGGRNVDEATGRGDANLGLSFALVQHPVFQRILRTGQVA